MTKESRNRSKLDAFLPIFFFLPFLVIYIPTGLQLSGTVLTHPFNLRYEYEALKIINIIQVCIIFIPMIYFVYFGKIFLFKKVLIPFYTLIIFSIFSSLVSNDFFLSFKRLAITFIPMFCIIQYFSSQKEPSKIFNLFCNYFIIFVLFLCFYALIINFFDTVKIFGFPGSTMMDYMKIDLGENFYKFVEYFNPNHSYTTNTLSVSQKCGNIGFVKFFDIYFGQFYSCRNFYDIWLSRPSSLLSNTVGFSQLLLVSLTLIFNKFLCNKNNYFLLFFLIFLIFFLWTFSRINLILLIISIIFLIIPFKNISKIISISLICITFSFLLIIFLSTGLLEGNYLESRHAINLERLSLFLNIANYWDSYGFTGVGFGLSYEGFLNAIKTKLNYQKHLDIVSIPSTFITILVELGLIGFIIFNLSIFFPIYYSNSKNKILIILIFCIFLSQLTDISIFRFHPFNFLFAFLIGLISNNNYQNEKIEK